MPRIAAAGVRIQAGTVAIREGATIRAGDPVMSLQVGNLTGALYAEVGGVVKDVRVVDGAEVLPDRIVCWVESQELRPLRTVSSVTPESPKAAVVSAGSDRVLFQLPPELLSIGTPAVRQVLVSAGQNLQADTAVLEVALGLVSFSWRPGITGTIAELLVKQGDALPNGTATMRIGSTEENAPGSTRQTPAATPPSVVSSAAPAPDREYPELSLSAFRETTRRLREKVLAMAELMSSAGLANSSDLLKAAAAKLADPHFSVAVVGEFKRGKSTFLNALAGGDFLPSDVTPCTAFACRFQYGEQLQLALVGADGTETLSASNTREAIGVELNRLTRDPTTTIREAIVRLPLPLCRDGVDLIDTPGLNDSESMNRVTLGVLPNVDAAVLLLIPESPLSETERRFLLEHLMGHDVSRIVVVLNAKDRVLPAKLPRLLDYLKTQIDQLLAARDVEPAPLYCVSAKEEMQNPNSAESGFPELRIALSQLLFRQRGRLILSQTMQRTKRAASEALSSVKLRLAQMAMSRESFDASLNDISRQLATARLHSNEIRRRLGEAQAQANSAANAEAQSLSVSLLSLHEALPPMIPADLLHSATTDAIKARLTSLLQEEAGKRYQATLSKLMETVRLLFEPVKTAARTFADETEHAFAGLARNVYHSAVGGVASPAGVANQSGSLDEAPMNSRFTIQVNLSLGAMSWLLLVESTRNFLGRAGLSNQIEELALTKLRDNYGREIEKQVSANASPYVLSAQLLEMVRRPFDSLLNTFNQEMKVLLDDTALILTSLRSNAVGQDGDQSQPWLDLQGSVGHLLAECEEAVFAPEPANS
jgi:hypothetical protein